MQPATIVHVMRLLSESGSQFGSSGAINVAIGNDGWIPNDSTKPGPNREESPPLDKQEKTDGMLERMNEEERAAKW
jgi:hypothetical protein